MLTSQNLQTPLISFIIAYHNLPVEMLIQCIDSITALSLTKEEREIIVIDDGSDVAPINDIVKQRDDIIYIRQQNGGLSCARNMGIRCANGQYIQLVDADDYLLQAPYEQCLDIVRYHKEADMILFKSTSRQRSEIDFLYEGPFLGTDYMQQNNLRGAAWGYIFKRDILGDLRFTHGIFHEDEEFTPRLMLKAKNIYATKSEAYFYRQRSNSIINNKNNEHTDKRLRDILGVIIHLRDIALQSDSEQQKALNRRVSQLTMDYLYNIIRLTHSQKQLNGAIELLRNHQLYPLSTINYSRKYTLFRKMIDTKIGRTILLTLIK